MQRSPLVWLCLPALLGLALLADPGSGQTAAPEVTVQVVKYKGLADAVRQHRGKVVVVDFWATY